MNKFRHAFAALSIAAMGLLAGSLFLPSAQAYPTNSPVYMQTQTQAAKTITAAGDVTFNAQNIGTLTVRITGSRSVLAGVVQVSNDGTNWTTVPINPIDGSAQAASFSDNGFWAANTAGVNWARVHVTTLTTGNAIIAMTGTPTTTGVPLAAATNSDTAAIVTLTAHASGTVDSADQSNLYGRCANVVVDLTTTTTATVTTTVQGKDAASGKYYTLLAGAAKTANGTTLMNVCPGGAGTANVSAQIALPKVWRVEVVIADNSGTAAVTGTVGASVIH